jgi:hypothetical protein
MPRNPWTRRACLSAAHVALFYAFGFTALASAQTLVRTAEPATEASSIFSKLHPVLSLQSSQYLSRGRTYFSDSAQGQSNSLILDLKSKSRWRALTSHLNLHNEMSATERWNYFDPLEAYVDFSPSDSIQTSIGRKLDTWSEWEEPWHQGMFQARYLENRWRSKTAGNIGLFAAVQAGAWSMTAGVLPVAVPEMGAHFETKDHEFVSRNPWFHSPASRFLFTGEPGEIHYSIDRPTDWQAVAHFGEIAKIEYRRDKYFSRFSFAYKPMPQILLGFPEDRNVQLQGLGGESGEVMNIRLHARFPYHQLYNWDQIVRLGRWTLSTSLAFERPEADVWPENWTHQGVTEAWVYAASISRPLEADGPRAARLTLGVLKVAGGDTPDRGYFAGRKTLFERRYQFQEAYRLSLTKSIRGLWLRPVDLGAQVIYDRLQNGGVFSLDGGVELARDWRADVQMDFLGLLGDSAAVDDGFLWTYRANDRVSVGMSYVF